MAKKEKKRAGKKYSFDHLKETAKATKPVAEKAVESNSDVKPGTKEKDQSLGYVYADLKRIGVIALGIVLAIAALYYLVNYSHLLTPYLKRLKLA